MSLINAIVNLPISLAKRCSLRQEFLNLDLLNIMIILRVESSVDLDTQLDVFMEEMEEDEAELKRQENNVTDPIQIIELIRKQVMGKESFSNFLSILQRFLSIPQDEQLG